MMMVFGMFWFIEMFCVGDYKFFFLVFLVFGGGVVID